MKKKSKMGTFDTFNSKRVSYILVTKNRAKLLNNALKMAQKLKKGNDEIIVVDGLSSDTTLEIIKNNKKTIDKYISEPDISPSHAANKGILLASGKYIKTIADDEIYYGNAMEKAIEVMENNNDIDILECGGKIYDLSTKSSRTLYKKPGINFGKSIDDIFFYGSNGAGYIIRRSSLAKIGTFPMDIVSDLTFMVNSIKNGANVKFCRVKLYKQLVHKNNISITNPQVSATLYRLVKHNAPKKYYFPYAFNYYIRNNPILKTLFFPVILLHNKYVMNLFIPDKKNLKNKQYIWDGGLS